MLLSSRNIALLWLAALALISCHHSDNAVAGTIEVDEAHVAPRAAGRVQKIFAREGQSLEAGDPIVELDAAELPAQRDLAAAQVNAAQRDVEAQMAQLQFLRADAKRQQELLPVNYFHLVFSVPHLLVPLMWQNKKILFTLLFEASATTLLEVAADPKHLGAEIGFLSILHSWGQIL